MPVEGEADDKLCNTAQADSLTDHLLRLHYQHLYYVTRNYALPTICKDFAILTRRPVES
jgi:hypothetical protein